MSHRSNSPRPTFCRGTACQTHAVVSSAMSRPDAMSHPTLTQASLLRRLTRQRSPRNQTRRWPAS